MLLALTFGPILLADFTHQNRRGPIRPVALLTPLMMSDCFQIIQKILHTAIQPPNLIETCWQILQLIHE